MAAWVAGSASTANTVVTDAATVRVALTFSRSTAGFAGVLVLTDIVRLR
jgi:hypothetical protein